MQHSPLKPESGSGDVDMAARLLFFKQLQAITNRIHATANIDEIMLELSESLCQLFAADRLTLYAVDGERQAIVAKVKTGLHGFRELRLPINDGSVAGYVAHHRQLLNLPDVYDEPGLKRLAPGLHFLQEVDKRTGYRTRQMLVAPILEGEELLGVVQLINTLSGETFSPMAEEGLTALVRTLAVAFSQRSRAPREIARSRYDALVELGALSAGELELAQRSARRKQLDMEAVLVKDFQVPLARIGEAASRFFGVPYEGFRPDRIKPGMLLRNLKRDYVEANQWIPVDETPEGIVVLAPDPERVRNSRVVSHVFPGHGVVYRVTTLQEFGRTVDQFFGALSDLGNVGDLISGAGEEDLGDVSGSVGDEASAAADNELVRLVNKIIVDAHQQGASDIHIEPRPGKDKTLIRFRKDGSLVPYVEVPHSLRSPLVARIKIMCDLDISEKRRPQDGKIQFKKYGPLDIELRVATLPTAGGVEDVVMRILAGGEPIPLPQLGLSTHNHGALIDCVEKPYGLFFVCGPTGSGKTTTLHSILGHLNRPDAKIWTAEDPVEITQKGLRQVQVNKKAGLDFATVMKAFLRADPDIIMVGEMRDAETTGIGIEASLTGHLVFATLHTNSAPESIIRLLDMGMDPFNFADALLGILAQRLAKRLCKDCKEAYQPDGAEIDRLLAEYAEELRETDAWRAAPEAALAALRNDWLSRYGQAGRLTLYRPRGCEACGQTGYRGRVGLHELLVGSPGVKGLIQAHARVAEILALALNQGMRTLKMDGVDKVLQGLTDLAQVRAVCIK